MSKITLLTGLLALCSSQLLSGQETVLPDGSTLNIASSDGERIRVIEEEMLVRVTLISEVSIKGYLGFLNDSIIIVDSTEILLSNIEKIQYNDRKKLITGSILTVTGPLLFLTTVFLVPPGSNLLVAAAIVFPALFIAGVAVLISNNIAYRIGEKWTLSIQPLTPVVLLPGELPAIQGPGE